MIRVCHVLASVGEKGGLEKNVIELANQQVALGHAVSAVADETMRAYFAPGVNFVAHPMGGGRLNPLNLRALKKKILSTQPQIVHAHANKAGTMVRSLRKKLPGIKRVATVQNIKRSSKPFRDYDAVITASAQVKDSLGGIPATVIWNSIAPPPPGTKEAALATNPPFLGGGEPVFSTVGRLVPAKGMDLLLEAMAQVPGFKLWLIGEGLQRPLLEELLAKHQLRERVWMAGHRDDAVGLMGCSDLFIVASRNEGGPYTLAEALHMRVPSIATRVGFSPEFLPAEAIMEANSVPELVRGLKLALADLAGLKQRQEPSFQLVASEVTLEAMTNKVLGIYEKLLGA
ncbi:glycosyltransferase [Haloferula sp. BvORR071]|uniref:glycosyltransferase n=1 Tax=Haloferula sp. BvORR071 TaxID=1396141 RepID=UPI0005599F01|nr:glycosyltransferase [Haloferula sp. BvORR071]